MIEITPAQLHIRVEVSLRAIALLINTVGLPGVQGAGVTGIQGIGVKTPAAADVALATVGFAKDEHMPKGFTFAIGM